MGKVSKLSSGLKQETDWEVEDALRTLLRAQDIKADAKMMEKVKALAKEKRQQMQDFV